VGLIRCIAVAAVITPEMPTCFPISEGCGTVHTPPYLWVVNKNSGPEAS